MTQIFVDSLYDAVVDCFKVLPILFLAYLLVAFLSHDHSHKFSKFLAKNNKFSVFYASLLGCVPQCGFSSVVADLYAERHVSLGALVAVFIATSDEAIPIMLSNPDSIVSLLILIAVKVVLALFWGYLIELSLSFVQKRRAEKKNAKIHAHNLEEECHAHAMHGHCESEGCHAHEICGCDELEREEIHEKEEHHHHECGHIHTDKCDSHCGHSHGDCCGSNIFIDAFDHTFSILIYIFVATFAINMIVGFCGFETLENLLTQNVYIQVIIASLIGLIPNCASSVFLVELYVFGSLAFPALVAGLTAGAGVGLVILWTRNKKRPLENLGILSLQYLIGVVSGWIVALIAGLI